MEDQEMIVKDALVKAWNAFVLLEPTHLDDLPDFRRAIHECQRILAMIELRRLDSSWVTMGLPRDKNLLQSLQNCLKVVRARNKPEYEVVLSELCETLDLNPIGTKCQCGADLFLSAKEVTGCGNCDPQ